MQKAINEKIENQEFKDEYANKSSWGVIWNIKRIIQPKKKM